MDGLDSVTPITATPLASPVSPVDDAEEWSGVAETAKIYKIALRKMKRASDIARLKMQYAAVKDLPPIREIAPIRGMPRNFGSTHIASLTAEELKTHSVYGWIFESGE